MKYIWLSHQLTIDTPMYGGVQDFKIIKEKSIEHGDSCNTTELLLPSHTGTHVDAPLHFVHNGQCIEDYAPSEWVFENVQVLTVNVEPGQIITRSDISLDADSATDAILLRTSFEKFRLEKAYWEQNPGVSPDLAEYFIDACPNLKIIGMDFISISSYMHRNVGRESHREFLGKGIRIIEDMHLCSLKRDLQLLQMVVLPMRFSEADGAPCTILGTIA